MSVPFVGREGELRQLRGLIPSARAAAGASVGLVTGDPGGGKSRLLREALADVDPGRKVLLSGFEPSASIPLAAAGDLVRRLAAVPDHGPRLESLVFGTVAPRDQTVVQAFEAAHRALAAFGPLVIGVDDLQWVDAQSIALLHYLIRSAEATHRPVTVLAVSRPSAAAAGFAQAIRDAVADSRRVSIELAILPRTAGIALAQAIDPALDDQAADDLWRRAAGSPFWLETLARERGSANVLDVVDRRLASLSADAARLVTALAIVARPATHDEVGLLTEWASGRVDQAVHEAVTHGLVSDGPAGVRLAHDLIREAARATVPRSAAQRLHARLAEVLSESAADDDLSGMAEALDHRMAAGLPTEDLATRLVTGHRRRLIGVDLLRRLSAIAEALASGSPMQIELDSGLGRLAGELGEGDLAIRHWTRVAAGTHDPMLRLRAEVEAARAALHGRLDLADAADTASRSALVQAHVARARALEVDERSAIELDTLEAEDALWIRHDTTAGARAAASAIARGRALAARAGGLDRLSADIRSALLAAHGPALDAALQEERPADVIELSAAALGIADGLGEEARLVALLRSAFPYRSLGFQREAESRYREAWDIAHRLTLPMSMIEAGLGLARSLHALGRLTEARAVAVEASEIEARILPWRRWDTSAVMLDFLGLSMGEPGALERLQAGAARVDAHFALAVHEFVAGWLARRDGARRAADVERALDAAWSASSVAACPRCARELLVTSSELLARIGRVEEARSALSTWEAGYDGPAYPARTLWQARARAAIAVADGDPEAPTSLAELAAAFDAGGRLEDACWARLDLGRALRGAGDRTGSIAAYQRAGSDAAGAGLVSIVRIANRALRELGVRAWRRQSASSTGDRLGDLSGREREVARLIAGGASNREIADTLVVSPKTVERHVTNILAKLGVRNRTELAGVAISAVRGFPDE